MHIARIFASIFAAALLFSMAGSVFAASPEDNPSNGPPDLVKIVLVHHAKDFYAGNPHGTPPGQDGDKPNGGKKGSEKLWYDYSGLHWGNMPVEYYVTNAGSLPAGFLDAVQASFTAWDSASGPYAVSYMGPTTVLPDTEVWDDAIGKYIPDMVNVVGWKDLGDSDAIGVTYYWYNTYTKELVDVDTALNSNSAYYWWQNLIVGDPDTAVWMEDKSDVYDVDVQNIMTHEAGHWLLLGDLYQKPAGNQTMYGISAEFELKKRSLESGDEAGIQVIYPNP
jgi:hypothetical protein